MLKGVNPLLNAPLIHALAAMGHGDEIVIVDRNYPAYAAGRPVMHLDGVDAPTAVAAILELFPLDTFVEHPLLHMQEGDGTGAALPVHTEVQALASDAEGRQISLGPVHRLEFYARARSAHAIVTTGESRPYGCFILVKGVLPAMEPPVS